MYTLFQSLPPQFGYHLFLAFVFIMLGAVSTALLYYLKNEYELTPEDFNAVGKIIATTF